MSEPAASPRPAGEPVLTDRLSMRVYIPMCHTVLGGYDCLLRNIWAEIKQPHLVYPSGVIEAAGIQEGFLEAERACFEEQPDPASWEDPVDRLEFMTPDESYLILRNVAVAGFTPGTIDARSGEYHARQIRILFDRFGDEPTV